MMTRVDIEITYFDNTKQIFADVDSWEISPIGILIKMRDLSVFTIYTHVTKNIKFTGLKERYENNIQTQIRNSVITD